MEQRIVHPYQWELIGAMIIYKVSGGLCLDILRITTEEIERIYKITFIRNKEDFRRWFRDRLPSDETIAALIGYIKDIYGYENVVDFLQKEDSPPQLAQCPSWSIYKKLRETSGSNNAIKKIREWAYAEVLWKTRGISLRPGFGELHTQKELIAKYAGDYQYFMPGEIPPTEYRELYVNPLSIKEDGIAQLENAHFRKQNKPPQIYYGNAALKDSDTLQIILFKEDEKRRVGMEYIINVWINNYEATSQHLPGIAMGFTGHRRIYAYPILLTTNERMTIESKFVIRYFEYCYTQLGITAHTGRQLCPSPELVSRLWTENRSEMS